MEEFGVIPVVLSLARSVGLEERFFLFSEGKWINEVIRTVYDIEI